MRARAVMAGAVVVLTVALAASLPTASGAAAAALASDPGGTGLDSEALGGAELGATWLGESSGGRASEHGPTRASRVEGVEPLGPARSLLAATAAAGIKAAPAAPGAGAMSASGMAPSGGAPSHPRNVTFSDLVAAFPADEAHMDVAKASRIWRKGKIRSYIALNVPPSEAIVAEGLLHNETWSFYPDDRPRRSLYAGDTRAALVPFLAHAHFGDSYLWLLYMDDDTVFVPAQVVRLVRQLDPDMAYFLTDHLWYSDERGSWHPNDRAPRCLPCGFETGGRKLRESSYPAPPGCPCTPGLLCATTPDLFNGYCDMPRHPENTYSMHGGAGGILSIGLMRAVGIDYMERCTLSLQSTGGDAFISVCLWQAGYAFTDPGRSVFEDVRYFDPGTEDRLGAMRNLAAYIDGHWEGVIPTRSWVSACDEKCELELDSMLSLHARSRAFSSLDDAASFIRAFCILYDTYAELRDRKETRERLAKPVELGDVAGKAANSLMEEAHRRAHTKDSVQVGGVDGG